MIQIKNESVKSDSEILSAGEGSYSDLRNDISNGGSLTKSIYYYRNGDGGTIEIKNTMTVEGNGAVIDMNGLNIRAFYVSGSNVTIKNLTIKNAFYDGRGGAIYFKNSGNVTNCNFINNSASQGGAIWMNQGSAENCNFTNNKATGGDGGAINFNGKGTVTYCNFADNKASSSSDYVRGGAVCMGQGNVENCNFINNLIYGYYSYGGAVGMEKGTVTNCKFTAKISYAGDKTYSSASKKVTLTVK